MEPDVSEINTPFARRPRRIYQAALVRRRGNKNYKKAQYQNKTNFDEHIWFEPYSASGDDVFDEHALLHASVANIMAFERYLKLLPRRKRTIPDYMHRGKYARIDRATVGNTLLDNRLTTSTKVERSKTKPTPISATNSDCRTASETSTKDEKNYYVVKKFIINKIRSKETHYTIQRYEYRQPDKTVRPVAHIFHQFRVAIWKIVEMVAKSVVLQKTKGD